MNNLGFMMNVKTPYRLSHGKITRILRTTKETDRKKCLNIVFFYVFWFIPSSGI